MHVLGTNITLFDDDPVPRKHVLCLARFSTYPLIALFCHEVQTQNNSNAASFRASVVDNHHQRSSCEDNQ